MVMIMIKMKQVVMIKNYKTSKDNNSKVKV